MSRVELQDRPYPRRETKQRGGDDKPSKAEGEERDVDQALQDEVTLKLPRTKPR